MKECVGKALAALALVVLATAPARADEVVGASGLSASWTEGVQFTSSDADGVCAGLLVGAARVCVANASGSLRLPQHTRMKQSTLITTGT